MSAIPNDLPVELPKAATPAPVLRTLVICDLADSTALVEKLGDQRAADIMRQHDRVARDLVEHHGGREIDKTDGFLILFDRPVQAVAFALDYQRSLRALGVAEGQPLAARIGIHVGDVVIWDNNARDIARGAKPVEVEGLVKPTAARIMSIARPGQILVSGMASTLAQRARSEIEEGLHVRWRAHGNYRFKGLPEPVQVHEVGEEGIAPFRAPAWSGKAHRETPWWRRPGMLFVEVAIVIVALGVPAYFALRSPPAIAFAERDWVVVGDLHNLTGQNVLDDSLDAAFRISLEQSRFVNLVSSLQVSDALKRMQKANGTKIDRAIGSEIAMREGARALILPTVAEVGGRVRVTAEVVDPKSQATVYAETADGAGLDSILPSVGKVSGALRARLGEALASVEANGIPLPKETTSNLDALRAYALGVKAYSSGQWADALSLYDQAIKLDPNFALAYRAKGAAHFGAGDAAAAKADLQKALALRDRLPPRDALQTEAMFALLGKPTDAMEKYKVLGELYPDTPAAYYNYALVAYLQGQYADGITQLKKGINDRNPIRGRFYYFLGALQLAMEDFSEIDANLAQAQAMHAQTLGMVIVDAAAARRRFADAQAALADSKPTGIPSNDIAQKLAAISLFADQGHWPEALQAAEGAVQAAHGVGPFLVRRYTLAELGLIVHSASRNELLRKIRVFLDGEIDELRHTDAADRPDTLFNTLFAGYLAARVGDGDLANVAIAIARDEVQGSGRRVLENALALASAERARATGKPTEAIALLKPFLSGSSLYATRVALRDAYLATGQNEEALSASVWLAEHRGLAYEEANNAQALQPFNVVESDLALLGAAEAARALGKEDKVQQAMQSFRNAWPSAESISFVTPRLDRLADVSSRPGAPAAASAPR